MSHRQRFDASIARLRATTFSGVLAKTITPIPVPVL